MIRTCAQLSGICFLALAFIAVISQPLAAADATAAVDFQKQIRHLLSDRCFACHGPDAEQRQGAIRFDQKESAFGTGDSGQTAIVPGEPEKSELVARITSQDPDVMMPPPDSNKKLTPEEQQLIAEWIRQGANWEEHWAYRIPSRPETPAGAPVNWQAPLDALLWQRMQTKGLSPASPAEREVLIRRATLDLTGLPPTLEEIDAFLNDKSPGAYERLLDRLLESPRYGEHQAHYWLDAARYGDTHGLHLDNYREMWPYRDWVIQAFNNNMPYDQFLKEQLAGDLLENPTEDQIIATGFNRCNVTTSEGGSIAEEVYVRNVVDRVNTFGTVFLGATLDCTRCHDHKFDPYTMHDYYSLFAYFNNIDGSPLDGNRKDHAPVVMVPDESQKQELQQLDQQLAKVNADLQKLEPELNQLQKEWEDRAGKANSDTNWLTLKPTSFRGVNGTTLTLQDDLSLLASGTNPAQETYEVIAEITQGPMWTVRLEGLIDPTLTNGGAGRSSNSNVVLTGFECYLAPASDPENWQPVSIARAAADHEQSNGDFKIENALDDDPKSGWAIAGHEKKENRTALFVAASPFGTDQPYRLKVVLKHESQFAQHQFGRIRVAVSADDQIANLVPEAIRTLLATPDDKKTGQHKQQLKEHFRNNVCSLPEFRTLQQSQTDLQSRKTKLTEQIPTTLVFREKAQLKPSYLLKRGEYDQQGEEVSRRTPLALPPMREEWPNNRLGLAYWLVSEENPLTARVEVNRIWQSLFGVGLVKTTEDFGSQGEAPSHPELLDWLAIELRESGWDRKALLKKIMLSSAYQQSSRIIPAQLAADPQNRLISRGPRYRLDAEMLRDQALFVSGLLVEKIGGPSVKPPQPDGLWFAVGYTRSNTARFVPDEGAEKIHRRTLYTFLKRTAPAPQMAVFDGPSRESSCVRRERTNTPLQSLLLLNDPQYVEFSQGLAARAMRESASDPGQIATRIYRLCTGELPTADQLSLLVAGFEADREHFRAHPEQAAAYLKTAALVPREGLAEVDLAAWSLTSSLVLNLDQVVSKN